MEFTSHNFIRLNILLDKTPTRRQWRRLWQPSDVSVLAPAISVFFTRLDR